MPEEQSVRCECGGRFYRSPADRRLYVCAICGAEVTTDALADMGYAAFPAVDGLLYVQAVTA